MKQPSTRWTWCMAQIKWVSQSQSSWKFIRSTWSRPSLSSNCLHLRCGSWTSTGTSLWCHCSCSLCLKVRLWCKDSKISRGWGKWELSHNKYGRTDAINGFRSTVTKFTQMMSSCSKETNLKRSKLCLVTCSLCLAPSWSTRPSWQESLNHWWRRVLRRLTRRSKSLTWITRTKTTFCTRAPTFCNLRQLMT